MLQNSSLLGAAWVTLKVAFTSSCFATVLGTIAGLIMSRFGAFSGHTLFSGMIYAPLVMPEVITGLSLLLMFVAIALRSAEHTSELQSLMRISYAVFCLKKKTESCNN